MSEYDSWHKIILFDERADAFHFELLEDMAQWVSEHATGRAWFTIEQDYDENYDFEYNAKHCVYLELDEDAVLFKLIFGGNA